MVALLTMVLAAAASGDRAAMPSPLQEIDVIEKLGDPVPLDLPFTDAQGRPVRLRDFTSSGRPVLLTLGYQRCPMLCSLLLTGVARAAQQSGLRAGHDFLPISVSIDPEETGAADWQARALKQIGQSADPGAWPFLTGPLPSIRALADAVGFKYAYDPKTHQFAHDAAAFVLTPHGRISRYLYGVEPTGRDLRLSLVEASGGRVGTSFDRFLLACYRWDPAARRYGLVIRRVVQGSGAAAFLVLAVTLGVFWRRELRRSP